MKILGLGLSRTGTNSLHAALELLGYSSVHFPWPWFRYGRLAAHAGLRRLRLEPGIEHRFDAILDTSVLPVWKQLDREHPGTKFILTVRDKDSWLDSCSRFGPFQRGGDIPIELRCLRTHVYGSVYFDRRKFADAFDRHHAEIDAHFRMRRGDLLELNVCAGEGFEHLCPFLGRPVLEQSFPWKSASSASRSVAVS